MSIKGDLYDPIASFIEGAYDCPWIFSKHQIPNQIQCPKTEVPCCRILTAGSGQETNRKDAVTLAIRLLVGAGVAV